MDSFQVAENKAGIASLPSLAAPKAAAGQLKRNSHMINIDMHGHKVVDQFNARG
jgi:hypothetical protein